jgi:hypothetical protein
MSKIWTREEYENRPRFPVNHDGDFEKFYYKTHFEKDTIFEIRNLKGIILYAKIENEPDDLFYDIIECKLTGESVRCPLRHNGVNKSEIVLRIFEGDWRIIENINISTVC